MDSRQKEILAVSVGVVAVSVGVLGMVTPLLVPLSVLPGTVILGLSTGLIISTILVNSPMVSQKEEKDDVLLGLKRASILYPMHSSEPEDSETLVEFDRALSSISRRPTSGTQALDNIDRAVSKLYDEFPEWEGEGRVRTYTLLKRISDLMDRENTDSYMGMAYRLLQTRNDEAAEYGRSLLNGKVEGMYHDPHFEGSRYVAASLIMMNLKERQYVEDMVNDAIHLWSDRRFEALRPELGVLNAMGEEDKSAMAEMVHKDIAKAIMVKDMTVASRAREILKILSASSHGSSQLR